MHRSSRHPAFPLRFALLAATVSCAVAGLGAADEPTPSTSAAPAGAISASPGASGARTDLPAPAPSGSGIRVTPSGSDLSRRVADEVRSNVPLAPAADLRIVDRSGTVSLGGWTATLGARERVAAVTEGTSGVRFVEMRMDVRPTRRLSDAELKAAVQERLLGAEGFEQPMSIDVAARDGVVTLTGFARIPDDKYLAERLVTWVDGPRDVVNEIRLDPEEGRRKLEVELYELLKRRDLDVADLKVIDEGDRLVINGVAHDVAVRQVVDQHLLDLPGGRHVTNEVRYVVTPAR